MHSHSHSHSHAPTSPQDRSAFAQRVTWIGAILDAVLGVAKIVVGWLFYSQALIADGIHSLSDLVTDFMVVAIVRISHSEPDEDHPYGHARFETLGTVLLGFLLVAVAGAMAYESTLNLLNPEEMPLPGWPALVIAAVSILSKEWIYRYTLAAGKRIKSDLLIANAWHSRTDAYSSIVVFVGVGGAMLGLPWLDSLAALAVALFVAKIGWDLSWSALRELVDTAIPAEELEALTQAALTVEGVRDVHSFKSRQMGSEILLELHLQVAPYLSASESHYIGEAVVAKLLKEFDSIGHIIFHIDTEDDDAANYCAVLPMRQEITELLDSELQQVDPTYRREKAVLHYIHGKVEVDLFVSHADQTPALDTRTLSATLNQRLGDLSWFRELKIWVPG
ncbi:cation diffusion facilitator family transporter [Motiliproteus sp. SC1-56]|uniref:cation diffusion facilitator family transporter n=1 Tax=Motiliproteus sp. SC1-56 TaxID=2799565 RepID=UPI001A8F76D5|nr:cation diffusion facilitator family transporter [Motiliproteus sp. SC1-56]